MIADSSPVSLPSMSAPQDMRYERKFLVTSYSAKDIEQIIRFHSAAFSEVYHERYINNIYFDSVGFNAYHDNVDGAVNRLKIRIRWYGDLFGTIMQPVLEYKIKKGLLGKKDSYRLEPFEFNAGFNTSVISGLLSKSDLPVMIKNELLSVYPLLLNRYRRKYFLSADKKFRLTIDQQLEYYSIRPHSNTFIKPFKDHSSVVELKYDSSMENEAKEIATEFPFVLTKNSKYLTGIERTLF